MLNAADTLSLIASIGQAGEDELFGRIEKAAIGVGWERALVAVQIQIPTVKEPLLHVLSGWEADFQTLYAQRDFMYKDPTVAHCQTSIKPIVWAPEIYSQASFELMEEARKYGMGHGLSVPVHESPKVKSMVSFARDKPFDLDPRELQMMLDAANVLAVCAHQAVSRIKVPQMLASERPKLSPRELEIMQYVAQGKGSEVIGDILNISKATVEFHVKNAFGKLGVASRLQAVGRVVAWGLV